MTAPCRDVDSVIFSEPGSSALYRYDYNELTLRVLCFSHTSFSLLILYVRPIPMGTTRSSMYMKRTLLLGYVLGFE